VRGRTEEERAGENVLFSSFMMFNLLSFSIVFSIFLEIEKNQSAESSESLPAQPLLSKMREKR
jgi:hypothetical protein